MRGGPIGCVYWRAHVVLLRRPLSQRLILAGARHRHLSISTFIPFRSNQRRRVFTLINKSTMRVLSKLFLAGLALAASPAKACDSTVDIVLETSGPPGSGFDSNGNDFDVLRELVLLTGQCHHWLCLHVC